MFLLFCLTCALVSASAPEALPGTVRRPCGLFMTTMSSSWKMISSSLVAGVPSSLPSVSRSFAPVSDMSGQHYYCGVAPPERRVSGWFWRRRGRKRGISHPEFPTVALFETRDQRPPAQIERDEAPSCAGVWQVLLGYLLPTGQRRALARKEVGLGFKVLFVKGRSGDVCLVKERQTTAVFSFQASSERT